MPRHPGASRSHKNLDSLQQAASGYRGPLLVDVGCTPGRATRCRTASHRAWPHRIPDVRLGRIRTQAAQRGLAEAPPRRHTMGGPACKRGLSELSRLTPPAFHVLCWYAKNSPSHTATPHSPVLLQDQVSQSEQQSGSATAGSATHRPPSRVPVTPGAGSIVRQSNGRSPASEREATGTTATRSWPAPWRRALLRCTIRGSTLRRSRCCGPWPTNARTEGS
jgi:hypothetical protein